MTEDGVKVLDAHIRGTLSMDPMYAIDDTRIANELLKNLTAVMPAAVWARQRLFAMNDLAVSG